MAFTIRQLLIARCQQEIDSGSKEEQLYKDFLNKFILASEEEIELNFQRNFDGLLAVRLVGAQLGNPPEEKPDVAAQVEEALAYAGLNPIDPEAEPKVDEVVPEAFIPSDPENIS